MRVFIRPSMLSSLSIVGKSSRIGVSRCSQCLHLGLSMPLSTTTKVLSNDSLSSASTFPNITTPTNVSSAIEQYNATDAFVKIESRSFVQIDGPDAVKFLQGMITNHMPKIETGGDGLFTGFLNAQGRLLFDAFIYPVNVSTTSNSFPHPNFLIECDTSVIKELKTHLTRYRLRNKITISEQEYDVYQIWGPKSHLLWGKFVDEKHAKNVPLGTIVPKPRFVEIGTRDQRAPELGLRVVVQRGQKPPVPSNFVELPSEHYTLRRVMTGIPEGSQDIFLGNSLPLESNFDYMQGVDFRKGCYLGQELTIRTYHRGVTRKRILPVQFYDLESETVQNELVYNPMASLSLPPSQTEIIDQGTNKSVGKVGSGIKNLGLALVRLEKVESGLDDADKETTEKGSKTSPSPLMVRWNENGKEQVLGVKPFIPHWWPQSSGSNPSS